MIVLRNGYFVAFKRECTTTIVANPVRVDNGETEPAARALGRLPYGIELSKIHVSLGHVTRRQREKEKVLRRVEVKQRKTNDTGSKTDAHEIRRLVISHAEACRFQISAVLPEIRD